MEMTGERLIPASRETVWAALNDPVMLQAAIPGCEGVEKTSDTDLTAKVALKIGPMAARFTGKVKLENINPPESYTITGEGNGGAMGFAKGGADVSLVEKGPNETLLTYTVKAQVGGKMAQLGGRLIDATAKQMSDQFFNRFAAQLTPAPESTLDTTVEVDPSMAVAPSALPMGDVREPGPRATVPTKVAAPLPMPAPAGAISILALIPSEIFGLPLVFWIGLGLFVPILVLLFLLG
jgi:uncharacterized protein